MNKNMMKDSISLLSYNIQAESKRLTAEEEASLAGRIQSGDTEAIDVLVCSNMGLVFRCANKYSRVLKTDLAEFVSAGTEGLLRAVREFDPSKGHFSTCAVAWIRKFILDDFNQNHPYVISQSYQRLYSKWVRPAMSDLEKEGITPKPKNIAERCGGNVNADTVSDILSAYGSTCSLDKEDENGLTIGDRISDGSGTPRDYTEALEREEALQEAIDRLPKPEHDVVIMHSGINGDAPLTLKEIADAFHLSLERVRQIELHGKQLLAMDARLASLA